MKLDEYEEKLSLLKNLIENEKTGRPGDLAKKLNVSDRTARRLIERLQGKNYVIEFDRKINSYVVRR